MVETPQGQGQAWMIIRDSVRLVPADVGFSHRDLRGQTQADHVRPEHRRGRSRWEEYNKIDCVALHEGMTRFHEIVGASRGRCAPRPQARPWRCFAGHTSTQRVPRHAHWASCIAGRSHEEEGSLRGMPATTGCGKRVHGGRTERSSSMRGENLRYYDLIRATRRHAGADAGVKNSNLEGHEDFWAYQRHVHVSGDSRRCLPEADVGLAGIGCPSDIRPVAPLVCPEVARALPVRGF